MTDYNKIEVSEQLAEWLTSKKDTSLSAIWGIWMELDGENEAELYQILHDTEFRECSQVMAYLILGGQRAWKIKPEQRYVVEIGRVDGAFTYYTLMEDGNIYSTDNYKGVPHLTEKQIKKINPDLMKIAKTVQEFEFAQES